MVIHKPLHQMLARLLCSVIGHLTVINSIVELNVLAPNSKNRYCVDLNDIEMEGKWVTSLTGKASFFNWKTPGEPSGGPNEDCVFINNGVMRVASCVARHEFHANLSFRYILFLEKRLQTMV